MTVSRRSALLALLGATAGLSRVRAGPPDFANRADAYFSEFQRAGQFSGTVLIANGDTILFERCYGRERPDGPAISADTRFPIASLSKSFTAAAIINLAREQRLRFDDRLDGYLPHFPNAHAITIDQLLRHASGVGVLDEPRYFLKTHPLAQLVSGIAKAKPLFAPGAGNEYSNEGYVLLAVVIERASGMRYADYLQHLFWKPLQLAHSNVDHAHPHRSGGSRAMLGGPPVTLATGDTVLTGASGLQSSARDLMTWMRAVKAGRFGDYAKLHYPYGWGVRNYRGRRLIEQSGTVEGFGSYMAAYDDGHFAIVLANVQSGAQMAWGADIAALLDDGAPSHPLALRGAATIGPVDVAGTYRNPGGGYPLRIRVHREQLEMTWGSYPFWRPISVIEGGDFIAMADYTRLRAERDRAGSVQALLLVAPDGNARDAARFVRL